MTSKSGSHVETDPVVMEADGKEPISWTFSTLGCPDADLSSVIQLAHLHGFKHLELRALEGRMDLPQLFRERYGTAAELAAYVKSEGVSIASLDASLKLIGNEAPDRAEFLEFATWAEALGTPFVRAFDGGSYGATLSEEDRDAALATIDWWRGERNSRGWQTDILIETHDALTSTEACLAFEAAVGDPVAILWDTHHTWKKAGEDPVSTWERLRPYVRHAHVKDSVSVASARHPYTYTPLGAGEFPLEETVAMFAESGFAYPVSIEWEKKWHPYLSSLEVALEDARAFGWW